MKKITLFTPCYNEEGNILELYKKVTDVMSGLPQYEYEYIIIDNCSKDNTPLILREIAENDKRVKVIFNMRNFGPARSGMYGALQGTGDALICFAADFQDPVELIPEFLKKWEEGNKIVWGKKTGSDESRIKYGIRVLYYKLIKAFAENEQYENVTGFGLYDREVMEYLGDYAGPHPNTRNMVSEFGYHIEFVEYHQPFRKSGRSSYSFFKYLNIALSDMVNTSKAPLRLATIFGLIVAVVSFILGVYYLTMKIIYWDSYELGIPTIAVGIFFIGAVQLISIGLIGEYVGEILDRMKKKPMVVEKERLNFSDDEGNNYMNSHRINT